MSFMSTKKDKMNLENKGNVLCEYERQNEARKSGNVLHEHDERQNEVRKYRKCPSWAR